MTAVLILYSCWLFLLWSTADPEVRSTIKLFWQPRTAHELLTHEELDGYILNAYAQALPPSGTLSTRMRHMRRDMVNMDTRRINEMISRYQERGPATRKPPGHSVSVGRSYCHNGK